MPIVATLAFIAAAAMAGIPLSSGFLSKEMMLEEASHTVYAGTVWLFPVLATAAALFSAAYSFRFAIRTFFGPARATTTRTTRTIRRPACGCRSRSWSCRSSRSAFSPAITAGPIVEHTARAVVGGALPTYEPALWHGFSAAVVMSAVGLLGGALLFAAYGPLNALRLAFPRPDAKRIHDAVIGGTVSRRRAG